MYAKPVFIWYPMGSTSLSTLGNGGHIGFYVPENLINSFWGSVRIYFIMVRFGSNCFISLSHKSSFDSAEFYKESKKRHMWWENVLQVYTSKPPTECFGSGWITFYTEQYKYLKKTKENHTYFTKLLDNNQSWQPVNTFYDSLLIFQRVMSTSHQSGIASSESVCFY